MWTIAKIEKKINLLKNDLSKKLGSDFQLYDPKLILERYSLNKLKKKRYQY